MNLINNISLTKILQYGFNYLSIQLISLLLGFFIATAMSTISAQTGDWSVIAASIIVTFNELISKLIYSKKNFFFKVPCIVNQLRIGIVYGLFVDAFKLGS